MQKNDEFSLTITGTTAEGQGVGRYEGMAVFVPETAEGETVTVHIVKVQKNYAVAKLVSVDVPSESRIVSDCNVSSSCGGCSYRHITYQSEKSIKEARVKDAFLRIGGIKTDILPIVSNDVICGYRNKAQYPVTLDREGKIRFGFFANHTHRVVPCENCLLQPTVFSEMLTAVKEWAELSDITVYDEIAKEGILRHIYLRMAEVTGEIMTVIVINADSVKNEKLLVEKLVKVSDKITSIQLNINKKDTNVVLGEKCKVLYGKSYIVDEICGIKVRLSPLSFYQVNRKMAELLYNKAAEFAEPDGKNIIDLYCGVGTIGLSMAKRANKLIGVEIVPEAIEDAKLNASENGINNAEFICSDATKAAQSLAKRKIKADVVILDPPRKGCTEELINTVANEFAPSKVVYVSCDPATLARDAKIFESFGYKTVKAVPFDLFPRTVHVETVALMSRDKSA